MAEATQPNRRALRRPAHVSAATALVVAAAMLFGACSESAEPTDTTERDIAADNAEQLAEDGSVKPTEGDGTTVLSRFQGAMWFDGDVPEPVAADDTLEPVRIGFMNVDSAPVGAMPELHGAIDGFEGFANAELGGIDGHPIEIVPCVLGNALAPEEAAGCARKLVEEGVVAVLGGIGLSNGAALAIFEENGIPWVGGIPLNEEEMVSPISFQFSGGSPGAFAAFAHQAVTVDGADKVAVLYAEYPSIERAAVDYGVDIAGDLGAEVDQVSYPMVSQDYSTAVQKALEGNPDALLVAAADLACAPVMQAIVDLRSDATVYLVGACADVRQLDKVGIDDVVGFRFNVEGRVNPEDATNADPEIYTLAREKYAPDTSPRSAATVAFRGAMNLWAKMNPLGTDATSQELIDAFNASVDVPSFDGHAYTCDGRQIPALPSLCAPQQVLVEVVGPNEFQEVSDGWVDVPTIVAETIG
ncbi:MAG: ABC transporter substrate-binding protein [Microthrixaceae bacterium]